MFDTAPKNVIADLLELSDPAQVNHALAKAILPDRVQQLENAKKRKWDGVLTYPTT